MRLACWLSVIILLAGCAGPLRSLPPQGLAAQHRIRVFTDGFHSGLIVERRTLPPVLNPSLPGDYDRCQLKSLHFGEEAWTDGRDMSWHHALRLAFIPGPGVLQSDPTHADADGVPGLDRDALMTWDFVLDATAMQALMRRISDHWLVQPVAEVDDPELPPTHLFRTAPPWSGFNNCHDFTIDLLRAAGLDFTPETLRLARNLTRTMNGARQQLADAGITVIGPPPVTPPIRH